MDREVVKFLIAPTSIARHIIHHSSFLDCIIRHLFYFLELQEEGVWREKGKKKDRGWVDIPLRLAT